jgi:hypothetical protein
MHWVSAERLVVCLHWSIPISYFLTAMHTRYFFPPAHLHAAHQITQINLVVRDYFKSETKALDYTDNASDLITWLCSKTILLAMLREMQAGLPGAGLNNIKTVIRAILTCWTMHYQSYRRL